MPQNYARTNGTTLSLQDSGLPQSSAGKAKPPFIHKFQTGKNKYIFDVNTMQIVRVEPVIWDIISDFDESDKSSLLARYRAHYRPDEISSAYEQILKAQQQSGLFLAKYPEILMPFTHEYLRQKMDNERSILLLNVTEDCNFRCSYCVYSGNCRGHRTHSRRRMSWHVAKKAVDEYLRQSTRSQNHSIGFYGGEPLLNLPLIQKVVDYVKNDRPDYPMLFSITTNGSLLTGRTADFLASGTFNITVSLDGPQDVHDRCRRTKLGLPTWEMVTSNVKSFLEEHPQYKTNGKLSFNLVLVPPLDICRLNNFVSCYDLFSVERHLTASFVNTGRTPRTPDLRAWGKTKSIQGLTSLYRQFLNNLVTGRINQNPADPEFRLQRAMFEQDWTKLHKRFKIYNVPQIGKPVIGEKFCTLSTCIPGERRAFLDVDGNYYICERVPQSPYLKIGDVNQGIDVAKIRQLLAEWVDLTREHCGICWCLPVCGAGCWSNICDGERPTESLKRQACARHIDKMHRLLVDYCSVLETNPHALDYIKDITIT
jgi:uncharacterized protein